jgi:hypothetical protein
MFNHRTVKAISLRNSPARAAIGAAVLAAGCAGVTVPACANVKFTIWMGIGTGNTNTTTSRWTYREGTAFPYSLMSQNQPAAVRENTLPNVLPGWRDPSQPNKLPAIFKHNNQGGPSGVWDFISNSMAIPLPYRTVFLRPSATSEAVLEFLAPSGYTTIKGHVFFNSIDNTCGNGIAWRAEHNGGTLNSGTLAPGGSSGEVVVFLPGGVGPGDKFDFVVDSIGNETCDTTSITGFLEMEP